MPEVELLPEVARWRARSVQYFSGLWVDLVQIVPQFQLSDFVSGPGEPANPFLQTVVRLPVTLLERPTPVGVVSKAYALVQHKEVAELCLSALTAADIETSNLRCEIGLSVLGEWMNFRAYLPERFSFKSRDGHDLKLRVEAFNSVDGSSRLIVLLSWLRLVCSNGLTVRESLVELGDIHNLRIDLTKIERAIYEGIKKAKTDQRLLSKWQDQSFNSSHFESWINNTLSKLWGKKAACRVFHICQSGHDVKISDPFEPGAASEKRVTRLAAVPGAPSTATNLYDVSQALSWVATRRSNAEQRTDWQGGIPVLINKLAA
jgi:hypothetical protein